MMFAIHRLDLACCGVDSGFVICTIVRGMEYTQDHLNMRILRTSSK